MDLQTGFGTKFLEKVDLLRTSLKTSLHEHVDATVDSRLDQFKLELTSFVRSGVVDCIRVNAINQHWKVETTYTPVSPDHQQSICDYPQLAKQSTSFIEGIPPPLELDTTTADQTFVDITIPSANTISIPLNNLDSSHSAVSQEHATHESTSNQPFKSLSSLVPLDSSNNLQNGTASEVPPVNGIQKPIDDDTAAILMDHYKQVLNHIVTDDNPKDIPNDQFEQINDNCTVSVETSCLNQNISPNNSQHSSSENNSETCTYTDCERSLVREQKDGDNRLDVQMETNSEQMNDETNEENGANEQSAGSANNCASTVPNASTSEFDTANYVAQIQFDEQSDNVVNEVYGEPEVSENNLPTESLIQNINHDHEYLNSTVQTITTRNVTNASKATSASQIAQQAFTSNRQFLQKRKFQLFNKISSKIAKSHKSDSNRTPNKNPIVLPQKSTESSEESTTNYKLIHLNCIVSKCANKFGGLHSMDLLNKHLLLRHALSPYRCFAFKCDQRFENRQDLMKHLFRFHLSKTKFHCPVCSRDFPSQSFAFQHWFEHHLTGAFMCSYCNEMLNTCEDVLNHQRRVHNVVGLHRFGCSHEGCTEVFRSNSDLNAHQIACNHLVEMKKTKRIVNNEIDNQYVGHELVQEFACEHADCTSSYTSRAKLKRHQLVHAKVRPFQCKQCHHRTNRRDHLIEHIRGKHFGLPITKKEQTERNIHDERDPSDLVRVISELL